VEDELLDIYEFGVPATRKKCFLLHGFDPLEHTKQESLEFCDTWLEATEDIFEEHISANCKVNPRDCCKVEEGKSALTNRLSDYTGIN
jgi:hypothetical protein